MDRPEHAISLSREQWLSYGDLTDAPKRAVEIDDILSAIEPFLTQLETECVADCCGIAAYSFWPETIQAALSSIGAHERESLVSHFRPVQVKIEALPHDILLSTRMNHYFRKEVLSALLRHIVREIEKA